MGCSIWQSCFCWAKSFWQAEFFRRMLSTSERVQKALATSPTIERRNGETEAKKQPINYPG
jgi:hypothetical protein